MSKMRIVYFQSGGPTAVINSSLCGVVKEAKKHPEEIEALFGSLYGVEGLIDDNLVDLFAEDEKDINLLTQTPGQILHSSRFKLPSLLRSWKPSRNITSTASSSMAATTP